MLTTLIETRRQTKHFVGRVSGCAHGPLEGGMPLGQRSRLVDNQHIDLSQIFNRGSVSKENPGCGSFPACDHDGHGRRKTQRTGARNDEHRHRIDEAEHQPGCGPKMPHAKNVRSATLTTPTTNTPATLSAIRCMGARDRCACATICTICDRTVWEPTFSERMTRLPVAFIVAPMTWSPSVLP